MSRRDAKEVFVDWLLEHGEDERYVQRLRHARDTDSFVHRALVKYGYRNKTDDEFLLTIKRELRYTEIPNLYYGSHHIPHHPGIPNPTWVQLCRGENIVILIVEDGGQRGTVNRAIRHHFQSRVRPYPYVPDVPTPWQEGIRHHWTWQPGLPISILRGGLLVLNNNVEVARDVLGRKYTHVFAAVDELPSDVKTRFWADLSFREERKGLKV